MAGWKANHQGWEYFTGSYIEADDEYALGPFIQVAALADSASGSDSISRGLVEARAIADTANGADAVVRIGAHPRSIADSANGTDAVVRSPISFLRSIADSANGADAVARKVVFVRGIADTANGSDSVARVDRTTRAIADSASGTDAIVRHLVEVRLLNDSAGGADVIGTIALHVTVVVPTPAQLLDLNVSMRQETVRFDLLDQQLNFLGSLAVDRISSIPEIVNDVNRSIRRTVSNFRLLARTLADADSPLFFAGEINTLVYRVQPVWILGDGGPGYEFPLGVYLWGSDQSHRSTYGVPEDCTLVDQCSILFQPLSQSVSYPAGTIIATALAEQATALGITSVNIDGNTAALSGPVAWFAGSDTSLAVMESLCAAGGYYAPYFDNDGTLRCRIAPNIATSPPDVTYLMGSRIVRDSILESNDLLNAPNRYIVIDNSATAAPMVGTFDVPASAPHSYANRGFRIVQSTNLQGLTDQAAADAAAQAQYAQGSSTYSWLSFESAPDPRHDTFNIVGVQLDVGGSIVNYREQGWRLPCSPGSKMHHDCRKVYA